MAPRRRTRLVKLDGSSVFRTARKQKLREYFEEKKGKMSFEDEFNDEDDYHRPMTRAEIESYNKQIEETGVMIISSAWNGIRIVQPTVRWAHLVWFSHYVPRWALIQWMAFHGRLSTKDRLFNWGVVQSTECMLYVNGVETHNHLFFECSFSNWLWKQFLRK